MEPGFVFHLIWQCNKQNSKAKLITYCWLIPAGRKGKKSLDPYSSSPYSSTKVVQMWMFCMIYFESNPSAKEILLLNPNYKFEQPAQWGYDMKVFVHNSERNWDPLWLLKHWKPWSYWDGCDEQIGSSRWGFLFFITHSRPPDLWLVKQEHIGLRWIWSTRVCNSTMSGILTAPECSSCQLTLLCCHPTYT